MTPSLITRRYLATLVAKKWKDDYEKAEYWKGEKYRRDLIYEKILELGDEPDPDEIDRLIGNGSWTQTRCSLCSESCSVAVRFTRDYSDEYKDICRSCVSQAFALFKEVK